MKQDRTHGTPPDKPSSQAQQMQNRTQRRGGPVDEREDVAIDAPGDTPRRPPPPSGSGTGVKKTS